MRRRGGFTLIELLVALLLLSLLAATVTLSVRGGVGQARMQDVVRQLAYQDQLVRARARQSGRPVQLLLDLRDQRLVCLEDAEQKQQQRSLVMHVPRGFAIQQVLVATAEDGAASEARAGQTITLPCSSKGHLPSYGLLLGGPDGQSRWLLSAGFSGEWVEMADGQQVRETFAALHEQSRHDAD